MPNDSELPFRLRQSTFRIYEPLIAQCLRDWPEPVSVNPAPLRATTVAARLRDAIISYKTYNWTSDQIDRAIFDSVVDKITVVHQNQTISIGPRRGRNTPSDFKLVNSNHASGLRFDPGRWQVEDLYAVSRLLGAKLFVGPVFVRPPLTIEMAAELETKFDVATTTDNEKTVII